MLLHCSSLKVTVAVCIYSTFLFF
uniref:Uncharacterized protein n=1 Tax=Arundo donax TaxID=35708 RepID=A0A0A8Z0Y8_ARUDO